MSLFAVVPLLTVGFAMLSAVPAFAKSGTVVQDFVFSHFLPSTGQEIQSYLMQFSTQAKRLTGIGIAFLGITAITMLITIEKEFNAIWRIRDNRKGLSSFLRYWAILSLGPLCVGLAIVISTYLASFKLLTQVDVFGIQKFLFVVTPFFLTGAAFTLLFAAVPNCRVPIKHALIGGFISALCFEIAKYVFARVMANASYQLVYGTFAAIPLFLLWIYTSWVIVLAGAELVYAISNYSGRDSHLPDLMAGLAVLQILWRKHQHGAVMSDREILRRHYLFDRYTLAGEHWSSLRDKLIAAGLVKTSTNGDYILGRDLHQYMLWDLYKLLTPHTEFPNHLSTIDASWFRDSIALLTDLNTQQSESLRVSLARLFEQPQKEDQLTEAN
jgi:membrane protein